MTILGIETSCDETALALIESRGTGNDTECRVISSLIHSQAELHSAYGGVFPTLAKREHGKNIVPLMKKLLDESSFLFENPEKHSESDFKSRLAEFKAEMEKDNPDLWQSIQGADFLLNKPKIDLIAVTEGPGLEPALWVGINFARILSHIWNIPLVPINHMEGHIVGSLLEEAPYGTWQKLKQAPLPCVALLISGGHTELIKVDENNSKRFRYEIIGETRDDALGEAFDKSARLLGLPYPGGPHLSMLAAKAREQGIKPKVKLPRPMIDSDDLDFSFAGLKTAVLYTVGRQGELTDDFKKELALEFENAAADVMEAKVKLAIEKTGAKSIIVGGGVSANKVIRERLSDLAYEYGVPILLPSPHISGDNALMIALAAALSENRTQSKTLKAEGNKRLS